MNNRICVVIPTYNRKSSLARAVRSVLAQSYLSWELRIVDDGSTDGTEKFIRTEFADPRILYHAQENLGVSAARNQAIWRTDCPYVALLDSDDEWLPEKLERQIEFLKSSNLPFVHTDEIWIRNGIRVNAKRKYLKSGGRIFTKCLPLCAISPSTVLCRTDLLKRFSGFREDYPVCEDYELWLRLSAQIEIGYLDSPLIIKYGGHGDQLSTKFKAMDEYRVQALWQMRDSPHITSDERRALLQEVDKKCEILKLGFAKYGHDIKSKEFIEIQLQAWAHLTHL
jgi:glycosyltransferase involved in cell wall biosynthesis